MKGFRKIESSSEPGRLYDVFVPDDGGEEVYVDGIHGTTLNLSVAKLGLFSIVEISQEPDRGAVEKRVISIRLVMPTNNLLEFCVSTLAGIAKQRPGFDRAFEEQRQKIMKILDGVKHG